MFAQKIHKGTKFRKCSSKFKKKIPLFCRIKEPAAGVPAVSEPISETVQPADEDEAQEMIQDPGEDCYMLYIYCTYVNYRSSSWLQV